ncbi:MAG: alpha-rhamnosidase, partial [Pedobacter sp.]
NQALVKAGLGYDYMKWLDIYRENMAMGLTTWAEYSDVNTSRSDCHAWGASPNIEFYRVVLGIDTDAPGFSKVKIEPRLGTMTKVGGEMPHPKGKIAVNYQLKKDKWQISVNLPQATTGKLVWKGKTYQLKEGINDFAI